MLSTTWASIGNTTEQNADFAYEDNFKLMAYNVFLLPSSVSDWSQAKRAELLGESDLINGYDAVILSELINDSVADSLLAALETEYPYQTPVLARSREGWDETRGDYVTTGQDGGVSIISRWPIEEKIQHIYSEACSASDEIASKGFVYVRLNKNGQPYHVIGTHTQSDSYSHPFPCNSGEAVTARKSQFEELHNFITEKNISHEEIVFIGGDLNVIRDSEEYDSMVNTLEVSVPNVYAGKQYSWDPTSNGIGSEQYPSYDKGQQLDYIFVSARHKQPSYWHNLTLDPVSPVWFNVYNFQEYSDHYPVAAFAYADHTTQTSSYRAVNKPYNNIRIRSNATNQYVTLDPNDNDGWLAATGTASSDTTSMKMDNWYPTENAFCIKSNDYVSIQGNTRDDYYWNWWAQNLTGQYGYYSKYNDPSNRLRVRILNDDGDCLKHGDQVAFIDGNTLTAGIPDYALTVWPTGSWKNYIFLWSDIDSISDNETFTIEMNAPQFEDWSNQLRYVR